MICRGFQWSIGTREHIPICDYPWLSNAARFCIVYSSPFGVATYQCL